jgi:hypothetical protein
LRPNATGLNSRLSKIAGEQHPPASELGGWRDDAAFDAGVSRLLGERILTGRGLKLSYGGRWRSRTALLFLVPLGLRFFLLFAASHLTFRHDELL